jgi:prevent-host-death family protein
MEKKTGTEIGAYEAKTHFSALIDRVAQGEELTITRNGTAVARLVPVRRTSSFAKRADAIRAIRDLATSNAPLDISIRTLIEEGRR